MRANRMGCLSGSGILAALFTLLVIGSTTLVKGGALYSPGDLNAQISPVARGGVFSHAETGGRCSACHTAPWEGQKMADRCLACHQELFQDARGFHSVMLAQANLTTCRGCHTDHNGSQAALTPLDLQDFPHREIGFSLQSHARRPNGAAFTCQDCHAEILSTFDLVVCLDCHLELEPAAMALHQADFGVDCLACHDGLDSYGGAFDHDALEFPLVGKHAPLLCRDCHPTARSLDDLRAAPRDCAACHAADDAHQGRFGTGCAACHTPSDWQQATFDHSASAFPLSGLHQRVPCEGCHRQADFAGTPTQCAACHADPPYHQALFSSDCAGCHTADGWQPVRFDRPHRFPLDHGEGGLAQCRVCHPDSLPAYTCYGCHEHSPQKIEQKHRQEGIADFSNCTRCHPTGRKEESKGED